MIETIRRAIDKRGNMPVSARHLAPSADLRKAGLTPFAAIRVMIEIERELAIEFPDSMLDRESMSSLDSILGCVEELCSKASYSAAA